MDACMEGIVRGEGFIAEPIPDCPLHHCTQAEQFQVHLAEDFPFCETLYLEFFDCSLGDVVWEERPKMRDDLREQHLPLVSGGFGRLVDINPLQVFFGNGRDGQCTSDALS